jgi:hypothetical protein
VREQIFLQDAVENGDVLAALYLQGFVPDRFVDATERTPFEIHFRSRARPETTAVFIRDTKIHVNYVSLDGPDVATLRDALEAALPHHDLATACERAVKSPFPGDRAAALFELSLARGPVPEPHVLRVLRDLLEDKEDGIRHSAVIAAAYFEWAEAEPLIDELIRRETHPAILEQAKLLKGMYQPADRHPITGFGRLVARIGGGSEVVWGLLESGRKLRVACIPQVVYNLSYLDLVEVEVQEGTPVIVRILEKSAHRTFRADVGVDDARYLPIETELLRQQVRIEAARPGRIGVSARANADLAAITGAFDRAGVAWEQADPRVDLPSL